VHLSHWKRFCTVHEEALLLDPDADPRESLVKIGLERKFSTFMTKARRLGIADRLNFPEARNTKTSRESVKAVVELYKAIEHEDKEVENRLKDAFIKRHAVKKNTFRSWVKKDYVDCILGRELVERKNCYQ